MTLIVRRTEENTVTLPDWVLKQLHLHEGEEVKTSIEGQSVRFTPLEQFLYAF